ncbi:hypothetical protein PYCC9005_003489 [Savitreella phatthalungensis]
MSRIPAVRVQGTHFIDTASGRELHLRGINLSGDSKFPTKPDVPSHVGGDIFWEYEKISFVGRPFPLDEADVHLARITSLGYNIVRFVFTWEAIEHAAPGQYDDEYIDYVIAVLRKCGEHGIYVLMDPHQDVWSRYSGGSGAPYWTWLAAGMNPHNFGATEAAMVHNTWGPGDEDSREMYPTMIWSSNYERAAVATIFTLFWAGEVFAPKCIINDVNIGQFLREHFFNAVAHVVKRIHEDAPELEDTVVIGWESLNEPATALVGHENIGIIPKEQKLRKGTCPTMSQAILLAAGVAQKVEVWEFGSMGPHKVDSRIVDPEGVSVWFSDKSVDLKYGWVRGDEWQLGTCIWQQHGVHDGRKLLRPDYFAKDPSDGAPFDTIRFLDRLWMPPFRRYKQVVRQYHEQAIIFCQPPVLKVPPVFTAEDRADKQLVYAPHFYDGLTLVTRHWNTWYNVDVLGVLRGRYAHEYLAVKLGVRAIRNCLRDQLKAMRQEGLDNMGEYPCFFTEIGIPYDLDRKAAYTSGDYSAQQQALDANLYALDGANVSFTLWQYSPLNTHKWGDWWNGEDLSIWSRSDCYSPSVSSQQLRDYRSPSQSSDTLIQRPRLTPEKSISMGCHFPAAAFSEEGLRAVEAVVRPSPILVDGSCTEHNFDIKSRTFTITVEASKRAGDRVETICFLPKLHFGRLREVDASNTRGDQDHAVKHYPETQTLVWTYPADGQTRKLRVRGDQLDDDGQVVERASTPFRFC